MFKQIVSDRRIENRLFERYFRRRKSTLRAYSLASVLLVFVHICSGNSAPFETLYDYYFPEHGEYINTAYRRNFDARFFGPPPKPGEERHPVYFAFHGDADAFHAFLNHSDRDGAGEFSESWTYECLLLLLRWGDDRFSDLLARENRKTREVVGMAIDPQILWAKHDFPKTRTLYSYRWVPLSKQKIEQRQGPATVEVEAKISLDNLARLEAALATDSRFSNVRVYRDHGASGIVLFKAPRALSKRDITDLQNLIQRRVNDSRPVIFK